MFWAHFHGFTVCRWHAHCSWLQVRVDFFLSQSRSSNTYENESTSLVFAPLHFYAWQSCVSAERKKNKNKLFIRCPFFYSIQCCWFFSSAAYFMVLQFLSFTSKGKKLLLVLFLLFTMQSPIAFYYGCLDFEPLHCISIWIFFVLSLPLSLSFSAFHCHCRFG